MSHFSTLVILPKGVQPQSEDEAQPHVEALLAPYDENSEAEPYEADCWCVDNVAQREGRERAERLVGTIDDFRRRFGESITDPDWSDWSDDQKFAYIAEKDTTWLAFIAPYQQAVREQQAAHEQAGKPTPGCEGCGGSGKRMTTYPPSVWGLFDDTGQKVAEFTGDEILPGVRASSGQRYRVLSHAEQESGLPVLVLQGVSQEAEQGADARAALEGHAAQQISDHPGGVSRTDGGPERSVRDLQASTGAISGQTSVRGSRSSDGSDSRTAVHAMQHGAGADGGRSESSRSSDRVLTAQLVGGAQWDWWEIGGRWDGALTADGRNVFPLADLAPGWTIFAIVTPDGAWHQSAKMGWWGMTSDDTKDWDKLQYEIASAFPEHWGVLADLHI